MNSHQYQGATGVSRRINAAQLKTFKPLGGSGVGMSRLVFVTLFGFSISLATCVAAAPNVIFICADDLNTDLGCYGHAQVKSPNVDRLAARGARFERAYCQYPVCNASRASFLSGRRPGTTGVIDNATPPRTHLGDVVFLPQHFRRHGYRTIKIGKIFHTGDAFEDPASWDVDLREQRTAKNPPAEQIVRKRGPSGIVLNCDDGATWDGFVARRGAQLLEEAVQGGQPFFLAIGFRRPHTPYIAPERYHDLYPAGSIAPLAEPAEHLAAIPQLALTYQCGGQRMPLNGRPDIVGSYYASISFMDAQLGLVLDAIDRLRLWDNTLVVFLSDHGYHLGEHGGLWHKMTLFEASARVPLLIAAPGHGAAVVGHGVVELVDLYPTLCDLCRLSPPSGLEGQSLVPLLNDPARPGKGAALTVVARGGDAAAGKLDPKKMGRSVRTDRFRYTQWFDGSRELYDYETDPHEYRNRAQDPELAAVVEKHRELLAELDAR